MGVAAPLPRRVEPGLDLRGVSTVLRKAGVDLAQVQGRPRRPPGRPEQSFVGDDKGEPVPGLGHIAAGLVEIGPADGVGLARAEGIDPEPVELPVPKCGGQELPDQVSYLRPVLLALRAAVGDLLGHGDQEAARQRAYDRDRALPHQRTSRIETTTAVASSR